LLPVTGLCFCVDLGTCESEAGRVGQLLSFGELFASSIRWAQTVSTCPSRGAEVCVVLSARLSSNRAVFDVFAVAPSWVSFHGARSFLVPYLVFLSVSGRAFPAGGTDVVFDVFAVSNAVYVCPNVAHFALDHGVSIVGLHATRAVHGPLVVFFFPGRLGMGRSTSHGPPALRFVASRPRATHARVASHVDFTEEERAQGIADSVVKFAKEAQSERAADFRPKPTETVETVV